MKRIQCVRGLTTFPFIYKSIARTNTVFAASQICSIFPRSHRYNIKVSIFVFFIPFKGPLKKKRIEVLEGKGLDRKGRVKKKKNTD